MLAPDQTRQSAVFDHLRHSILSGALPGGGRLPPTRSLAQELGVARQTVVLAYERLAAEGYVRGRTGSGTYVATDLPDQAPAPAATPPAAAVALSARGARLAQVPATASARDPTLGLLLAGGLPAPDLFPIKAWARCASRVLKPLSGELSSYPPPQGLLVLREQIAAHLAATRGLVADPGCIVVTGGTQQALRTAADLLLDPGDHGLGRGSRLHRRPGRVARRRGGDRAGSQRFGWARRRRRGAGSHRTHAWRWSRHRMPRRWAALCRSAAGWRCWTGRAGQRLGVGGRLRLGVPLGGQAAAAAGDAG